MCCSLVATAAALTVEKPPDLSKVQLPSVPAPLDVGKTGFPEMPTVPSLLSASASSLDGFNAGAAKLQEKMKLLEQDSALRLQHQKTVFDQKLKEQEEKNAELVKSNGELAKNIMKLKKENDEALAESLALQKGNSIRRKDFKLLEKDLEASKAFINDAIITSDDSKAPDLEVLKEEAEPGDEKALSFLSVEEAVAEEITTAQPKASADAEDTAESLMTMLESSVKDVKQKGKESEEKLKQLFLMHFQAGVKRHKALLAQQQVLQSTQKDLTSYREKILAAKTHLQNTQSSMDSRLKDGGLFLQKVSQVTLSKPEDAVKTLSSLSAEAKEK